MRIASSRKAWWHPDTYKQVLKLPLLGFIISHRTAGISWGELCQPRVTTRRINKHTCPFPPWKQGRKQSTLWHYGEDHQITTGLKYWWRTKAFSFKGSKESPTSDDNILAWRSSCLRFHSRITVSSSHKKTKYFQSKLFNVIKKKQPDIHNKLFIECFETSTYFFKSYIYIKFWISQRQSKTK